MPQSSSPPFHAVWVSSHLWSFHWKLLEVSSNTSRPDWSQSCKALQKSNYTLVAVFSAAESSPSANSHIFVSRIAAFTEDERQALAAGEEKEARNSPIQEKVYWIISSMMFYEEHMARIIFKDTPSLHIPHKYWINPISKCGLCQCHLQ